MLIGTLCHCLINTICFNTIQKKRKRALSCPSCYYMEEKRKKIKGWFTESQASDEWGFRRPQDADSWNYRCFFSLWFIAHKHTQIHTTNLQDDIEAQKSGRINNPTKKRERENVQEPPAQFHPACIFYSIAWCLGRAATLRLPDLSKHLTVFFFFYFDVSAHIPNAVFNSGSVPGA